MARKRLGELLLERRIIAPPQLDQALAYQRQTGHRLGAALVALGFVSESQLCDVLAQALGMKAVAMPPAEIDWTALHSLRSRFCEANDLFPLSIDTANPARKAIVVAMADPLNIPAIEEIEFTTGMKVVAVIAPLSGIRSAIRRYYLKEQPGTGNRMTVVHQGGQEVVAEHPTTPVQIPTGAQARPPPAPRAPSRPPAPPPTAPMRRRTRSDEEMPVLQGAEVVEVTERTALADLIRERAEKRRKKKPTSPEQPSVDDDLNYLFGMKAESPDDEIAKLETKFWALLRIMAKKGLITREEFLRELTDQEEE